MDSITLKTPYYLTFENQINDSMFAIGYYDLQSYIKIKEMGIDRDYLSEFKDSLIQISEVLLVFNENLKIVDSTIVIHNITTKDFNNIYAPFIDDIEFETKTLSLSFAGSADYAFPLYASSLEEFNTKYKTLIKYGNFCYRNIKIERKLIENQFHKFDTFSYWQILFSKEKTYIRERMHPHFLTSKVDDYEDYIETNNYYLNNKLFYSDTLNWATNFLLFFNDNNLSIATKHLPHKSNTNNETKKNNNVKLKIIKFENYNLKNINIEFESKIPISLSFDKNNLLHVLTYNVEAVAKYNFWEDRIYNIINVEFPFHGNINKLELQLLKLLEVNTFELNEAFTYKQIENKFYLYHHNNLIYESEINKSILYVGKNYFMVLFYKNDQNENSIPFCYYKKI